MQCFSGMLAPISLDQFSVVATCLPVPQPSIAADNAVAVFTVAALLLGNLHYCAKLLEQSFSLRYFDTIVTHLKENNSLRYFETIVTHFNENN